MPVAPPQLYFPGPSSQLPQPLPVRLEAPPAAGQAALVKVLWDPNVTQASLTQDISKRKTELDALKAAARAAGSQAEVDNLKKLAGKMEEAEKARQSQENFRFVQASHEIVNLLQQTTAAFQAKYMAFYNSRHAPPVLTPPWTACVVQVDYLALKKFCEDEAKAIDTSRQTSDRIKVLESEIKVFEEGADWLNRMLRTIDQQVAFLTQASSYTLYGVDVKATVEWYDNAIAALCDEHNRAGGIRDRMNALTRVAPR